MTHRDLKYKRIFNLRNATETELNVKGLTGIKSVYMLTLLRKINIPVATVAAAHG